MYENNVIVQRCYNVKIIKSVKVFVKGLVSLTKEKYLRTKSPWK